MRPTALIPVLCCAAALVLGFLCIFAGQKRDWMEDYHMITLNTSRIGYNVINTTTSSSNPLSSLLNSLGNDITSEINDLAGDIAQELGIDDFYSVHMLDYCYGDFTPGPVPNATLSSSQIHKNVTACSNRTAAFHFDPTTIINQKLNESGTGITLDDLNWPDDIQKGLDALHIIQTTYFVLYCIAVGFIFISFILSLLALFTSGRLSACLNFMMATLAFLAIGLASALVTAVIVKGVDIINKYGEEIGVSAYKGGKFLALTWAATGVMLVAMLWWVFETCVGHRKNKHAYVPKA